MAKSRGGVATHAGTRRSETRVKHPYEGLTWDQITNKEEESKRFPGFHTVVVPKQGHDANAASPVGLYRGMGYKVLSEDPEVTGHGNDIIMGIDLEVWKERKAAELEETNGLLTSIHEDILPDLAQAGPLRYFGQQSGVTFGESIQVSGALPDSED